MLAIVGVLVLIVGVVVAVAVIAIAKSGDDKDSENSAHASTSTETTSTESTVSPSYTPYTTTTTTTPETIYYGAIAFSGSGAYKVATNYPTSTAAKTAAVNACNQAIWSKGWPSDSYCGWVPMQTGWCASVATAPAASGWGPTGWANGRVRSSVITAARDKCTSIGQGTCSELITTCM